MNWINKILSLPFLALIKIYQIVLSPLMGSKCRYMPTCSNYAIEAFKKYHFIKAFYLSSKRILSCHPWGKSGYDPVP